MNTRSIAATASTVLRTADDLGVQMPNHVRSEITEALGAIERTSALDVSGPSFADAVSEAAVDGRDPLTDPAVVAALVRDRIGQMANMVDPLTAGARSRLVGVLRDWHDDLIAPFQPAYAAAGATLCEVHAVLGDIELDDAVRLVRSGVAGAAAYADAQRALATINRIDQAVGALLTIVGRYPATPLGRIVFKVDAPDAGTELLDLGKNPNPWAVVRRGWAVSLATLSQVAEREARAHLNDDTRRAAVRAEEKGRRPNFLTGRIRAAG